MAHLRQHWLWYAGGALLLAWAWNRDKVARMAVVNPTPQPSNAPPAVAGFLPSNLPTLPGPGGVVDVSTAFNQVVNAGMTFVPGVK